MATSLYNNFKAEISGYSLDTQIGEMRNICYHLVRSLTQTRIVDNWSGIAEMANKAWQDEQDAERASLKDINENRWNQICDRRAELDANLKFHIKRLDSARKLYAELSGKTYPLPNNYKVITEVAAHELGKE